MGCFSMIGIVVAAGDDDDCVVFDFIDEAVLVVDPSRIEAR